MAAGCIRLRLIWKELLIKKVTLGLLADSLGIVERELCVTRAGWPEELKGGLSVLLLHWQLVCFLVFFRVLCAIWHMRLRKEAKEQISAALLGLILHS